MPLVVLAQPSTGEQFLACRGTPRECDGAYQIKQAALDAAAAAAAARALLESPVRRRLRLVRGEG